MILAYSAESRLAEGSRDCRGLADRVVLSVEPIRSRRVGIAKAGNRAVIALDGVFSEGTVNLLRP